jgi:microcystin-dependent protein
MGSFNVYFSDPNKIATPIVVEDGVINTVDTSLSLIGKNVSGFSSAIATDFVQMLENFASATPPNNPIQGQLWFDNGNNRLYVNDGTAGTGNWKPSDGVWRTSGTSVSPSGLPGDLWVNEDLGQLFLTIDGTNWTLVGPNFSSTLKTGSYPETVTDKFGASHTVIKQYINNNVVEIISSDTFVPQQVINGFGTLQPGVNLNANYNSKLNATAYAAENILVSSPYTEYVTGNNFVRNDIDNTISASLNITTNLGLGTVPTFVMKKVGTRQNLLLNSVNGGEFSFQVSDPSGNGVNNELLTVDGDNFKITVGNSHATDMQLNGNLTINGTLSVALSTLTNTNFEIKGPARLDSTLNVGGTATFTATTIFTQPIQVGLSGQPTSTLGNDGIYPLSSSTYNLGKPGLAFANVYSRIYSGLNGTAATFIGNASSANSLSTGSIFQLGGQLSGSLYISTDPNKTPFTWNGSPGTYAFNSQLGVTAITDQVTATSVALNDLVIAAQTSTNELIQITKANFLQDLYNSLVPAGTILPWAGLLPLQNLTSAGVANKKSDGTYNWLLCDGSFFYAKDYPSLFAAIGYTYGGDPSVAAFQLPDMRGRMAIGYDNFSNNFIGSPSESAGRVPGANVPNYDIANQGLAPLVVGGSNTATITANVSGPDGVSTSTATQITSVMNPYHAFNYIIKT